MLTALFAHDTPGSTAELWRTWSRDPVVWLGLVTVAGLYAWGLRTGARRARPWLFAAGLATVVVAVVSPLDALSGSLASAHMAQHLLLTSVAAPLLVLAGTVRTMSAALPSAGVRIVRMGRSWPPARSLRRAARNPVAMAALHTLVLWFWHASGPYDAAVRIEALHALEHATLLATGLLAWSAVLSPRVPAGLRILASFGLSVQGALLGALLTFAPTAWYSVYADTTEPWGLSRLGDQQLAGVLMWGPGGVAYLVVGLWLLVASIATEPAVETELSGWTPAARRGVGATSPAGRAPRPS